MELLLEINSMILKETISAKIYYLTSCNSRKFYLSVILLMVGVRLVVVVVVVVVGGGGKGGLVVIILLCEKDRVLCGVVCVCVCVCYIWIYLLVR